MTLTKEITTASYFVGFCLLKAARMIDSNTTPLMKTTFVILLAVHIVSGYFTHLKIINIHHMMHVMH